MFLLPLGYMPSLVWCIQNLFHTNTQLLVSATDIQGKLVLLLDICVIIVSKQFSPIFLHHTLTQYQKKTSTESNEADEIYLLSRTKKLYIIFQHIDKPFYLKFWMQCMSYIKTISTL